MLVENPSRMLFTAGQLAIRPGDPEAKVIDGNIEEQTELALQNLTAVLAAEGFEVTDIAKVTAWMTDLGEFARMNTVYAKHMGEHLPARAVTQAAGLPKGAKFEIEAIAVR